MEARWISLILVALPLIWSCSDQTPGGGDPDSRPRLVIEDADIDVPIVSVDDADAEVDPCENVSQPSDAGWCSCQPQCCQAQQWFCPPVFGEPSYFKKEVVVDICDENLEPCLYGHDPHCPPPEIIIMGECEEAYECPPTAAGLDYGWQWCELEDGTVGKQKVTCDKGQLYHSPCQACEPEVCDGKDNDCDGVVDEDLGVTTCMTECGSGNSVCVNGEEVCFGPEPQEEICDYLDNDCDGDIDEFQTNVCGQCGPVPAEECNAFDDDCDGDIDEDLVKQCSTACGTGVEICTNGTWSGCTATQPQPEICDGLDNDCNGQIDDGIECLCTIQDVGTLFPCAEPPLLCGQGFKTCECVDPGCQEITTTECFAMCYWMTDPPGSDPLCDALVGMPLEEEACNNFDDNCNQLIDEDLVVACYTGPEGTLDVGICEPGIMTCLTGAWGGYDQQENFVVGMCADETVPQPEICDGLDNDCDGQVDWGEEIPDTDILFVVDWSGSMNDEIDAVLIALNQFAANYADQDALRWGLVVAPRQVGGFADDERLYLISDIATFPDFLAAFAALGDDGMDTGSEMLLDALYLSLQNISANAPLDHDVISWSHQVGESVPPKEQFNLSWRPGVDRIIVTFSDENPQSYMNPQITEQHVIDACQATPQAKIYTFSTNEFWQWDEIADACGGVYFELTNNALDMYNSLSQILDEICMPE
tara:strand:+ start:2824 stop:4935 length:2112 start_codon:yes stop_codon:yes gene_type:complete